MKSRIKGIFHIFLSLFQKEIQLRKYKKAVKSQDVFKGRLLVKRIRVKSNLEAGQSICLRGNHIKISSLQKDEGFTGFSFLAVSEVSEI